MVETLERRGGEYQAHSLCIYLGENGFGQNQPTSVVLNWYLSKNRLFTDQYHMIISMAQVSNPSRV